MDVPLWTPQDETWVGITEISVRIPQGELGYIPAHPEFLRLIPIYWHVESYGPNNCPTHL